MSLCSTLPDIQYNEVTEMLVGRWLKVEVNEISPYWNIFYEKSFEELMEEDVIPETPISSRQLVANGDRAYEDLRMRCGSEVGKGKEVSVEGDNQILTGQTLDLTITNSYAECRYLQACSKHSSLDGKQKQKGKGLKANATKRQKRFFPYNSQQSSKKILDEFQLLDTPIQMLMEVRQRALVASPQKPPRYK